MGASESRPEDRIEIIAARLAMRGERDALAFHLQSYPGFPLDFALTSAQCKTKELRWKDHRETLQFPTRSTLLHVASTHDRLSVMEWLLQSHVRLLHARDEFGSTPLLRASIHNQIPAVHALLKAGADINAVNTYKCSALHFAAAEGHMQMVSALLRAGADASLLDSEGRTAEMCKRPSESMEPAECPFRSFANKQRQASDFEHDKSQATEQEERKRAMMEAGMAASKAVAFRLAKLALVGAPAVAAGAPPLMERAPLESLLYETVSCHPVVFFLAGQEGDADSAGHSQVELSDFLLPMLKPFLDESPHAISDEVKRGLASFMQTQKERAKKNELLRRQMENTEKQLAALSSPPAVKSASPPSSSGADWAKRFKMAAGVLQVATKIIH